MKTTIAWMLAVPLLTLPVSSAFGGSELSVDQVLEAGQIKEYVHHQAILLTEGFWAIAGSEVTARIMGMDLLQMGGYPGPGPAPPKPSGYYAINAIEIQEENENPCFLRLWGNMVDPRFSKNQDRRIVAQFELEKCKGFTTFVDSKMAGFQPLQNKFIRAANVCGGHAHLLPQELYLASNWEIKGLRVRPGQVSSTDGTVTPLDEVHEFTRHRCPEYGAGDLGDLQGSGWTAWSTCPVEGQLATGMTLYYYKDKWFTSMDLGCQYVQQLYGPIPVKDEKGY